MGPLRVPFPTRMTVVRLPDGIWLHSPIAFDPALADAVATLGAVRWLIAPNKIHYAGIQEWLDAFAGAESWGVDGIDERASANGIRVTLTHRLGQGTQPWVGQIDQLSVMSGFMEEVDFFHRASRTLILTDLIEAFSPARVGPGLRLLLRLAGNLGPVGSMPRDMRATFRGRRDHLRDAVRQMLAWQPERVILAHGECYWENATDKIEEAFSWLL